MEKDRINELLNRYWEGETTIEEEKHLRGYFNGSDVDAELSLYTPLFKAFTDEAQVTLNRQIPSPVPVPKVRVLSLRKLLQVAAVFLLFGTLFYLLEMRPQRADEMAYADTFDDPNEAYAEVKKALLMISIKMNKGLETTSMSLEKMEPLEEIIK